MKIYQIAVEDKDSDLLFQILQNLKIVKYIQNFDKSSPTTSSENAEDDNWTKQDWQELAVSTNSNEDTI
ncbi:MAG: hypothetical protein MUE85_01750 [Microscillaceae bacterium]|jgi:hypothetical protein|nr:hypothetical protein [Microscillaceae bacterium]